MWPDHTNATIAHAVQQTRSPQPHAYHTFQCRRPGQIRREFNQSLSFGKRENKLECWA